MQNTNKRNHSFGLENQIHKHTRLQYSHTHTRTSSYTTRPDYNPPTPHIQHQQHVPEDIDDINITNAIDDLTIDYFNIGTINIQQAIQTKFQDILLYFKLEKFSVLALTETGLYKQHTKPITQNINCPNFAPIPPMRCYYDNNRTRGSGVATLISHELS